MTGTASAAGLEAWFQSGRIIDLILAAMLVEAVGLLALRRFTGRGPGSGALLVNLAAGASLLLAVRTVLDGSGWTWTALALAAALACHVADLQLRWRRRR